MSLVFAAIAPHPPLLIPSIGKEAAKKIDKTRHALEKMEEDLYLSHPDTIVIFSPHSRILKEAFSINISPELESDLREFGDLATKLTVKGELNLMSQLRKAADEQKIATMMITEKIMDHGLTIPLYFLTAHLPNVTVLPIGFCDADAKTHLEFGSLLKDQIMNSTRRVAVIASGDLSHSLTTDAPGGFNPAGPEFDTKIQELLATQNTAGFLQLDSEMIKNSAECGFRTFLMLMGVLRGVHYTYQSYAYEAPFGVGYLTANFAI